MPFVAGTVLSHPSKLDLIRVARAAGYTVVLHVFPVPEALTVSRVEHRVAAGGRSVPEAKIRKRYRRLWDLVVDAARISDQTTSYDNAVRSGPRAVAQLYDGIPIGVVSWPAGFRMLW